MVITIIDLNEEYYPYDKFIADAQSLTKQYESILQYVTIGKSHDNRDIVLLKLGVGKQYMVCCSGVHARETINPIVLLRIIEYYADLYVNFKKEKQTLKKKLSKQRLHLNEEYEQMLYGACVYELLQTFTILFVPILNPDGYMIATKGFDAIKNHQLRKKCLVLKQSNQEWKYNARTIDINRNFPCKLWKAKDENDLPASENETKTLIDLFHQYKASGFLDFHSRGKQIFYYRNMMPDSYNEKQLEIASRMNKITNYVLMPQEEEITAGDSGGNTVHYFSEQFLKPALTIETVDEDADFPLDHIHRYATFNELKLVIMEFGSMIV